MGGECKMERELLKSQLIEIREKDYQLSEDIKAFELVMDMMDYIGDTDGEFRDDIIYSSFVKFTLNDKLTNDELYKILDLCLDKNHLFFGIGEVNDKVFTRTFSLLWICVVLYKHINGAFLSKKDLIRVYDELVRYMHEEKDLRGYVREKGWGHSAAHSADVLAYLTNCKEMEHEELLDILNAVKYRVNNKPSHHRSFRGSIITAAAPIRKISLAVMPEIITGKYFVEVIFGIVVKMVVNYIHYYT
jgi:hypothetical protein